MQRHRSISVTGVAVHMSQQCYVDERCRARSAWGFSVLALVATLAASPAWAQTFPVENVSPPGVGAVMATAADPTGNVIVVMNIPGTSQSSVGLRATRYDAATGTWSVPVDLVTTGTGEFAVGVRAVMDPAGNAFVIWRHQASGTTIGPIVVRRYVAASNTWMPATTLSDHEGAWPRIVLDAAGNALVVWRYGNTLFHARYSPSGGWSSVTMADTSLTTDPLVAVDGSGAALVSFIKQEGAAGIGVYAKRFTTGFATVGAAARVAQSASTSSLSETATAVDAQGNALLVWTWTTEKIEAVRFDASSATWSAVERIFTTDPNTNASACSPDADGAQGRFMVVWHTNCGSFVQPARVFGRLYASQAWGPALRVSDGGLSPRVVVADTGDATAIWHGGSDSRVARFHVASGRWTGALTLAPSSAYGDRPLEDPDGAVRFVWWRPSDRWSGVVQTARWPAGAMPAIGPPNAPVNLAASVAGNLVSMQWQAPTIGAAPVSYTLSARRSELGPIVATLSTGGSTSFSVSAPDGTYFVSVTATNASGASPPSTNVVVRVPQALTLPPPPSNLLASVNGSTVTFGWDPSNGATGYVLVAGLSPAFGVPYATMPLGSTPAVSVAGVPAGTYYVRVQAQNAAGLSGPSNEVAVTVAGISLPGTPTLHPPAVAGSTVTLSWSAGSGGAPSRYTLIARTSPAGPPILTAPLTGTSVSYQGVPSGTYYLQLTASNDAGTSGPSPQVPVTVP
jgi:hypothetical protein